MAARFAHAFTTGAVAALLLCGCGTETPEEHAETVARVNGEEITVRQLNERMKLDGMPLEGGPAAGRKRALDGLINERLLVQKALAAGLDRQPETRVAIERARQQLLARAAVEARDSDDGIAEREVKAFFEANPNLFYRRKVYTFRRFTVPEGRIGASTKAKLDSAKTPTAVSVALRGAGLVHSQFTETIAAEALSPAILAQAARMSAGDILMFTEGRRVVLLQLASSISEPLALDAAAPSIEVYLADSRHQLRTERAVKELRRKAKIEYVTQTAAAKSTTVADGKTALDEPPLRKPLQSRQITVIR